MFRNSLRFCRVPLCAVLVLLAGTIGAQTASSGDGAGRGNYLTLKIAVAGPGDELYFWWGHIALIIEDAVSGESRFYDYGIFSFDTENFYVNFAFGRLLYSCGVSPSERSFSVYRRTNRDITVYTLDLPPADKEAVWRFAEKNVLPENRNYYYHHFKDNCATRIRDIIDLAVGGQFKARFWDAPGRYTLRQHVRRHTWFSPFMDWILNFLMGQDIDRPITIWEEMFLPREIGDRIEDFVYIDSTGVERNLVSAVEVLNRAVNRPPVLDVPRRQWPRELILGIAVAAVLAVLQVMRRRKEEPFRVILGLSQGLLGLFFGLTGSILFFMTFFTDHDYTYHNSNILFINPLLLAALPLGLAFAFGRDPKKRFFREKLLEALWTYVFLGGVLTMVIKLFPGFYQQNKVTQALVLPWALVLSFIPHGFSRLWAVLSRRRR